MENVAESSSLNSLSKFTLFETKSRLYITASIANNHRVLKIDRTDPNTLSVVEDTTTYDDDQLDLLLRMVQDGNKSQGGLDKVLEFHGIVGFVKFTGSWYLILITKRSVVGLLGGHYIYHCDETTLLSVANKPERSSQETRLLSIFQQVDLSKNFYFSYSYDITNTLQDNLTIPSSKRQHNFRFMWNYRLLAPAFNLHSPEDRSRWILPLIHGFVDQAKINIFTRTVYTTLIARRSRHYAGARFRTRGVNEHGHVANEVETEQIVSEPLTTSFGQTDRTSNRSVCYGGYTSFVQYRGSIPVMWHQDSNQITPKPPIEVTIKDPFYSPAAKHFDDLLGRYGSPIFILNLVKSNEVVPRETKLLVEYGQCVEYLNQFLPESKKMHYTAWDMSLAAKNRHQDVMGLLEDVAEESIQLTNFFHGGPARCQTGSSLEERRQKPLLQCGIMRVNCVDCLDRTNAAQFAIAKRVFGHQLYALGLVTTPCLPFSCDAIEVLTEMYHDHGDTLAWQYTGSALVNRVDTYRRTKATQWTSHSRDLLENIRRFYNNSMLDADKQTAINLFLGVESAPSSPSPRPNYRTWFTPAYLAAPTVGALAPCVPVFREYYKPHILSQFTRLYAFTMNSTLRFATHRTKSDGHSPFEGKLPLELDSPTPTVTSPRRSASRWASVTKATQDNSIRVTESKDENSIPHPIETLVSALLEPPDVEKRIQDYEWYTHYHADELLSSRTTVESQDLQLYIRTSHLATGQDTDFLPDSHLATKGTTMAEDELSGGLYEPPKASIQLYELYLRP